MLVAIASGRRSKRDQEMYHLPGKVQGESSCGRPGRQISTRAGPVALYGPGRPGSDVPGCCLPVHPSSGRFVLEVHFHGALEEEDWTGSGSDAVGPDILVDWCPRSDLHGCRIRVFQSSDEETFSSSEVHGEGLSSLPSPVQLGGEDDQDDQRQDPGSYGPARMEDGRLAQAPASYTVLPQFNGF